MKLFWKYLIIFLLGGAVFGYFIFNYQAKTLLGLAGINLLNSYADNAKKSIEIIENINKENFDQAINELESNIFTAKLVLGDCKNCSCKQKEAFDKILKYKFTKTPNKETTP